MVRGLIGRWLNSAATTGTDEFLPASNGSLPAEPGICRVPCVRVWGLFEGAFFGGRGDILGCGGVTAPDRGAVVVGGCLRVRFLCSWVHIGGSGAAAQAGVPWSLGVV